MSTYNIKRFLLDIVYPNKCPFCEELIAHNKYYCLDCLENLSLHDGNFEELAVIDEAFAVFEYNETTSAFVYAIKDGSNGYAISAAAKLLSEKLSAVLENIDLITCIPGDSIRTQERGYNPPALISKEISAQTKIPCNPKLLVKTRRTETQKSLSQLKRRENLKDAFDINRRVTNGKFSISGKNLLLIDDVRTTGATLHEAASVLRLAGAEKVYAAVVANTALT